MLKNNTTNNQHELRNYLILVCFDIAKTYVELSKLESKEDIYIVLKIKGKENKFIRNASSDPDDSNIELIKFKPTDLIHHYALVSGLTYKILYKEKTFITMRFKIYIGYLTYLVKLNGVK